MINFGSHYEENFFKELRQSRFEEHHGKLLSSRDFENELSRYLFVNALAHIVINQLIVELDLVLHYIKRNYSFLMEE